MSRGAEDRRREERLRRWLIAQAPGEVPPSLRDALDRMARSGPVQVEPLLPGGGQTRDARRGAIGVAAAAVLVLALVGTGLIALATRRPDVAASVPPIGTPAAIAPVPTSSATGDVGIGTPVLLGEQPGATAALANTSIGPIVAVYDPSAGKPIAPGTQGTVGPCPASRVGIIGSSSVAWTDGNQSILYLAGDASASGAVGIGLSPDCGRTIALEPASPTRWMPGDAPSSLAAGVWWFGMRPGDPTTVAAWSPAGGQLAAKGGFISWSSDGGRTWQSQTDAALPAGWDWSGTFWRLAPGRLVPSRGPAYAVSGDAVPVDVSWDPWAGQVPPVMATGVFRDHVLIGVRDDGTRTADLESVATDGSGTARLAIAVWRISAGSRFVAVEGKDLESDAPTLAISTDGLHFVTRALPEEFATAPTDSVQLLALDDRVILTDGPLTPVPTDRAIHVWSVPVLGAPAPPPAPSPAPTPIIPSAPPAVATSRWTPVTLPSRASGGVFGGPDGNVSALPGGGFIDFVPESPTRTLVYTSPDGSQWAQTSEVTGEDALAITGPVATDGRAYVALGAEGGGITGYASPENGAVWVSADLRTWTKAPVQAAFEGTTWRSLAGGPGGFVATGFSEAAGGSPAWFSSDGLHWTTISDDRPTVNDTVEATSVVYARGTFVMAGRLDNDAASWTSPDGRHWALHAPLPAGSGVVLQGLVATASGFLSLGQGDQQVEVAPGDFRGPVAPWTSTDGTSWRAGAPSEALFGSGILSLVAAPGGLFATGMVGSHVTLWSSRDGIGWVAVAGVDLSGSTEARLVSDGSHVLLIANTGSGQQDALVTAGIDR